ncbi:MAG: hypothetical protein NTV43_18555 [Methylococcales bacterium]|nr:hypothetical protein [Methylococcales bacterium]
MKIASFNIFVNGLFTVYEPSIITDTDLLVNAVTTIGVAQGFSWRRGNVDFYTIDLSLIGVEVFLNDNVMLPTDTKRAVQVPFDVVGLDGVGINDELFSKVDVLHVQAPDNRVHWLGSYLPIPPGHYTLTFAQGFMPNWNITGYQGVEYDESQQCSTWAKLWFNQADNTEAKVLVDGSPDPYLTLNPTFPLNMNATPLMDQN